MQVVLNSLYKHTVLQSRFPVNAVALVAGTPETLGLRQMLHHFLHFRVDVVRRRARCGAPCHPLENPETPCYLHTAGCCLQGRHNFWSAFLKLLAEVLAETCRQAACVLRCCMQRLDKLVCLEALNGTH